MRQSILVSTLLVAQLFGQVVLAEESGSSPQGGSVAPSVPTEKREQVINQREQNQEKRIEQGEKSGQLTSKEAARLEKEQQNIKKMEKKAESDGKLSKKEMRRIEKAQDRASADIYKKKHNKRKQ